MNNLTSILLSYDFSFMSLNFYFDNKYQRTFSNISLLFMYSFALLAFSYICCLWSMHFFRSSVLVEQNIGSVTDNFVALTLAFSSLVWFFLGSFLYTNFSSYNFHVWSMFPLLLFVYLLNMFLYMGVYYVLYIKGSGQSSLLSYNLLLDNINTLSFFSRVCIQIVRIVIVFCSVYFFNHLFLEIHYFSSVYSESSFVFFLIHVFFEWAHTLFVLAVQLSVFYFVVTWLFQFLLYCFHLFYSE